MINWHEKPKSQGSSENPRSVWFLYSCSGTSSSMMVRALAAVSTAVKYDGLWRQDIAVEPLGTYVWDVKVTYGPRLGKKPNAGEFRWQFDTTGGTAHVTHGLRRIAQFTPNNGPTTDYGTAINVTDDGSIEGCDIVVPQRKWTETWQFDAASLTFDYGTVLEELTGKLNASAFRGLDEGQVLFMGATGGGSTRDGALVELTYSFVGQRIVANLTVGEIQGINKDPWDYISFISTNKQEAGKFRGKKLIQADVMQLYELGDFSQLGIGTGALAMYYGPDDE